MNDSAPDVLDPPRSKLRALAIQLDQQLALLCASVDATKGDSNVVGLSITWRAVSKALDLGAEPSLRACPHCLRRVPEAATRCRYCMAVSPASVGASHSAGSQ